MSKKLKLEYSILTSHSFAIKHNDENELWSHYINWLNDNFHSSFKGYDNDCYYGVKFNQAECDDIARTFDIILTLDEWYKIISEQQRYTSKLLTDKIDSKIEYQLFIGKVSEIIGFDKTLELLKECKEAFI